MQACSEFMLTTRHLYNECVRGNELKFLEIVSDYENRPRKRKISLKEFSEFFRSYQFYDNGTKFNRILRLDPVKEKEEFETLLRELLGRIHDPWKNLSKGIQSILEREEMDNLMDLDLYTESEIMDFLKEVGFDVQNPEEIIKVVYDKTGVKLASLKGEDVINALKDKELRRKIPPSNKFIENVINTLKDAFSSPIFDKVLRQLDDKQNTCIRLFEDEDY